MVAFITGNGLGLLASSGSVLGSGGKVGEQKFGRTGDNLFVNATNGNLVVQRSDEILIGMGPDVEFDLTYNSQGEGGTTGWGISRQPIVSGLTGTVNTAGSTVNRRDWDRNTSAYTYDTVRGAYVSKSGGGAYDEIRFASNVWTWTDGNSRVVERYDNLNSGNIFSWSDADGNTITFRRNGSNFVDRMTTSDGGIVDYVWTAPGLTSITTTYSNGLGGTSSRTRTSYGYDGSGRLQTVTVDLTPGDNSTADGQVYVTTYGYDGTSTRISWITQTDGSRLDVGYTLYGSDYRVTMLTQAAATGVTRVTSLSYDISNRVTTVTNPQSGVTTLTYDAQGQLTQLTLPAAVSGGSAQVLSYAYDSDGNVTSATDAAGNVTTYAFDTNGNQTVRRDALGNTVTRTYGSKNELLTETVYAVPDLDGIGATAVPLAPLTTRYAYDAENHLRYAVSAEGRVTEYRYNAVGQQVSQIEYTQNAYNVSGLGASTSIAEASLNAWVSALADKSAMQRTDTFYDFRGNVGSTVSYASLSLFGESANSPLAIVPGANTTVSQQSDGLYRVTKTSGSADTWNADAHSSTKADGDFVLRVRAVQSGSHIIGGVATAPGASADYTNPDFGFNFVADGSVRYMEAGTFVSLGVTYVAGDNFWLVRTGGTINYYKGATLTAAIAAGALRTRTGVTGTFYSDSSIYTSGASIDVEFTPQSIVNGVGTGVSLQSDGLYRITKTGTVAAWDADARSTSKADGDFVLHLRPPRNDVSVMGGVAFSPAANSSYTNLDYGFFFQNNGIFAYFESGAGATIASYNAGDDFWLVRTGTTINYYKGATLEAARAAGALRTQSSVAGTLYFDSSMGTPGSQLDVDFMQPAILNGAGTTVSQQTDGLFRVTKTGATGAWDADGRSTVKADADFVLRLRPGQANAHVIGGVARSPAATASYENPDYGLYFVADGTVRWMEGGQHDLLGTYAATDNYWLVRSGSTINYYKGATLDAAMAAGALRTKTGATGTFSFDSSFWTAGGILDVSFTPAPAVSRTYFVYDQAGNLLSRYADGQKAETFVYDGLGRVTASTDLNGQATSIAFNDASGTTVVTLANGLTRTSIYNLAGELIGYAEADSNLLPNPLLIDGTAGWNLTNAERVAGGTGDPLPFLFRNVSTAGTAKVETGLRPLPAGTTFNASFTVKPGVAGQQFQTAVYWYDSGNNFITQSIVDRFATDTANFTTYEFVATRPANAVSYTMYTAAVPGATALWGGLRLAATTGGTVPAVTTYKYDSLGRLRFQTDPTNLRTYFLYDRVGRKVADIDADGSVVEYGYTANDLVNRVIHYATKLSSAQLASLMDGSGNPAAIAIADIRPLATAADRWDWNIYDNAGRLIETIDGVGATTIYSYDGASRLLSTTAYANLIASGTLASFKTAAPATLQLPAADSAGDRVVRSFYDKDGLLIGTLDAEGYLAQNLYDKAGRKTQTIAYATATSSVYRAAGSFDELLGSVTPATVNNLFPNPLLIDGTAGWSLYNSERVAGAATESLPFYFRTLGTGGGSSQSISFVLPPGDKFKLSYTVKPGFSGQQFQTAVTWVDSAGNYITQSLFDRFPGDTANFTTYEHQIDRPANAVTAYVYTQVVAGGVATWGGHRLTLDNVVANSQLAADTSGWTLNGVQRVAGGSGAPTAYMFQTTGTGGGSVQSATVAVPEGTTFDMSLSVKPGFAGQQFQTLIYWVNSAGVAYAQALDMFPSSTTSFTTYTATVTRPSWAVTYAIQSQVVSGAVATWGNIRLTPKASTNAALNPADVRNHFVYDGKGQLLGAVDGEGGVTRYRYDALGNVEQQVGGQKLDPAAILRTPPTAGTLLTAPGGNLEQISYTRNSYGQPLTETRTVGGVAVTTAYQYDQMRNLVGTTTQSGGAEPRTGTQRYDKRGRLLGELSGIGSAALAALGGSPTQTQIDGVYAAYGTSYAYDTADRLISTTEPQGRTLYYYTDDGDLALTVTPLGEVTEYRYDALGQRTDAIVYAARIASGTLSAMTGGFLSSVQSTITALAAASVDSAAHIDYNVTGTVRQSRDALGYIDTYAYNSFRETIRVAKAVGGNLVGTAAASDSSFEAPEVGVGYAYNPAVSGVTFSGGAGVAGNNSAWGFAAAPDGDQVAFLQGGGGGGGSISQTVSGLDVGNSYQLSFYLAARPGFAANPVTVAFDGVVLGTFIPGSTSFTQFTTPVFQASASSGTITFTGAVSTPDIATGLDKVVLTPLGATVQTSSTYDRRGLLLSERRDSATGGLALTTSYGYDAFGRQVTLTDPKNQISQSRYDRAGRLVGTTDPLTRTESFVYDPRGNLVASTDKGGKVTRYVYNEDGRLIWTVDATGGVVARQYDPDGRLQLVRAYEKALTSTNLNALALQTSEAAILAVLDTSGQQQVTRYFHNADGQMRFSLDAASRLHEYGYDAAGNLIRTIDYDGTIDATSTYTVSYIAGQIASKGLAALAKTRVTRTVFDADNRAAFGIDASGAVTAFTYDSAGNLVKQKSYAPLYATAGDPSLATMQSWAASNDAGSRTSRAVYDRKGQLAYSVDALGQVTEYQYDKSGKVTKQVGYADAYTVGDGATPASMAALIGTPPSTARTTTFGYDSAGRLVDVWDALNNRTHMALDELGRVTQSTGAYGTSDARTTFRIYDALGRVTSETRAYGATEASTTFTAYDALGRATDITRGYGTADASVTHYTYDDAGRVKTQTIAYGAPEASTTAYLYDAFGRATQVTMASGTSDASTILRTYDSMDRVLSETRGFGTPEASTSYYAWNAFGDMLIETDGRGTATMRSYDAMGRVLKVTRGSSLLANGSFDESAAGFTAQTWGRSSSTLPGWTKANPLDFEQVASGLAGISGYDGGYWLDLDAAGGTGSNMDISQTVGGLTAGQAISLQFDHANRTTAASGSFEIWWNGALVATITDSGTAIQTGNLELVAVAGSNTLSFKGIGATDGLGASLDNVRLFNRDGGSIVATNVYDSFGNLVKSVDARGNAGYFYYDALNRMTLQVDREGYATATGYTLGGEVASVTHYAARVTGTYSEIIRPNTGQLGAVLATTSFAHDKLERVTGVTDAENYGETYVLNAFGERTSATKDIEHSPNPVVTATTTYTYDKLGQLLTETLPVSSIRSDGTVQATSVVNKYEYDTRGNRRNMVEALGLTEARTTNYTYDKADRLTFKTGDALYATSQTDYVTNTLVTPTEQFKYDARGNVIETSNALGARTLFYYDHLDRKIAEIGALGSFSAMSYDRNGNVATSRAYGTTVTVPASPGGNPPSPPAGEYRETSFTYDLANRQLTSSVAGLRTGAWNGSAYSTSVVTVTTSSEYDLNGNVVTTTDGEGGTTFTYYDKLDRRTAQVDQENYLTAWSLDADGNALNERRYATKAVGTPVVAAPPSVATHADDRVTEFTYDRDGRRLTETRTGVLAYGVDPANGALNQAASTATVVYAYNGLGLVTRRTEATGDYVDYAYDGGGRLLQETRAPYYDQTNSLVRPTVRYSYDGLNDLTVTRQGGETAAAGDRFTRYTYGAGGRLATMTDADGDIRSYFYDAAGNSVRESYFRLKSDGTSVQNATLSTRDLLGRSTSQAIGTWNGSSWVKGDVQATGYNAYGEISQRGINGGWQEQFGYDTAGRLWRTNSGDGVWRYFVYDGGGRQTLTLESEGTDLSNLTIDQALAIATVNGAYAVGGAWVDGINATISVFDKRGETLSTRQPFRELSTSVTQTLATSHTYNAFGEVMSETDARSNTTDFLYNSMGRLIEKKSPTVSWTSESGAVSTARPTETYYYDKSGRMIGIRDANSNTISRLLLAGAGYGEAEALVTAEFHPDGGVFRTYYDHFGDARILRNELAQDETRVYDAMGRITAEAHRGGLLTDYYAYDLLGQRIKHWNSQLGGSVVEKTDFDAQGRVVSQVNFAGDATTTSYIWNGSLATAGMGTFGGWTKTTVYPSTSSGTENIDMFGRTVGKTDLGAHSYTFTYDKAGRLTAQSGPSGSSLATSYFNTGRVSQIVDTAGTGLNAITSTYGYDANGNRTYEGYGGTVWSFYFPTGSSSATTTLQNATIAYDAMGRITAFTDRDAAGATRITIANEYDLAGNVRRVNAVYPNIAYPQYGSQTEDHWYRYDSMNRMVVADGSLQSGAVVRGAGGVDLTYDAAGRRRTATRDAWLTGSAYAWTWYPGHGPGSGAPLEFQQEYVNGEYQYQPAGYMGARREEYDYRADGALTNVKFAETGYVDNGDGTVSATTMPSSGMLRAENQRDAMGRVTRYLEYDSSANVTQDRNNIVYNARDQLVSDSVSQVKNESGGINTYVTNTSNNYSSYGLLNSSAADQWKNGSDSAVPDTTTTYSYGWWDDARVSGTSIYDGTSTTSSTYVYDGLGRVASVDINDGRRRTVSFASAPGAQILARTERSSVSANPADYHYFVDGMQIGDLTSNGNNDAAEIDYAQSLLVRNWTNNPKAAPFRWNTTGGVTDGKFGGSGYDPISPVSQDSVDSHYMVRGGDTLQSVAQALWGDSSLWYMLAEANGLSGSGMLAAGQSLVVPSRVTNIHNSASTFQVYDPNEAMGDLNPTVPKPGKKANKCGIFGQILLVAIAVAVTALTQGAFAAALGPVLGGALGGALGSIVSQGFGVATGIQDKFSWKGVALAAIGGAVGGAMKGVEIVKGASDLAKIANDVAVGVVSNVANQGIGIATGLQSKFDWAGVAAAGVSAGVMGAVGRALAPNNTAAGAVHEHLHVSSSAGGGSVNYVNQVVTGMAGAIASAATRSLINGSSFGDNIIRALPDVIGTTIGHMVANEVTAIGERRAAKRIAPDWDRRQRNVLINSARRLDYISGRESGTTLNIAADDAGKSAMLRFYVDVTALNTSNYDFAQIREAWEAGFGLAGIPRDVADVSITLAAGPSYQQYSTAEGQANLQNKLRQLINEHRIKESLADGDVRDLNDKTIHQIDDKQRLAQLEAYYNGTAPGLNTTGITPSATMEAAVTNTLAAYRFKSTDQASAAIAMVMQTYLTKSGISQSSWHEWNATIYDNGAKKDKFQVGPIQESNSATGGRISFGELMNHPSWVPAASWHLHPTGGLVNGLPSGQDYEVTWAIQQIFPHFKSYMTVATSFGDAPYPFDDGSTATPVSPWATFVLDEGLPAPDTLQLIKALPANAPVISGTGKKQTTTTHSGLLLYNPSNDGKNYFSGSTNDLIRAFPKPVALYSPEQGLITVNGQLKTITIRPYIVPARPLSNRVYDDAGKVIHPTGK
jgi:YD repeat-containing protein